MCVCVCVCVCVRIYIYIYIYIYTYSIYIYIYTHTHTHTVYIYIYTHTHTHTHTHIVCVYIYCIYIVWKREINTFNTHSVCVYILYIYILFEREKLILLLRLGTDSMTLKTLIMIVIDITPEYCSFELSIYQRILKIMSHDFHKIFVTTVFNIDNNQKCILSSKSAY